MTRCNRFCFRRLEKKAIMTRCNTYLCVCLCLSPAEMRDGELLTGNPTSPCPNNAIAEDDILHTWYKNTYSTTYYCTIEIAIFGQTIPA